ncbi:hypothetical protein J2848_004545 [Azospirillum lipoferum]|uniref:Methyl-accepting transducer domain-containing protein n=1 Tax=Azospirillum lipoferum TaxID=193 RepID=A0A5A9GM30_AZOLI|nr:MULTISPECIES: hypothetical protein [Azospirillum]KAA0594822.1 hypothetical protein FZ942_18615 [Azospirillum lipoferum]MCP1612853.1 hypothetical protein [Azospirillum lipoferum]MDW5532008.1 hypothetical protein [Azospirillum sp. NL1]
MDSILDRAAFGDLSRAGTGALPSGLDIGVVRSLKTELHDASAPIEAAFLAVGETLSQTLARMEAIGERFRTLSALIDKEDGADASGRLGRVRGVTDGLVANLRQTLDDLTGLDESGAEMAALLGSLSRIIGEITALAINAKVQSVQIRSGSDDFSVFNREIDRLHRLAEEATTQAVGHLAELRTAISTARDGAAIFQRDNRTRLDDVGRRLQGSLDTLTACRNTAQQAARRFAGRAGEIGQRIARCISDLQVGDLTCQRLAHIGTALDVLGLLADPPRDPPKAAALPQDLRWLADLDRDHRTDLSVAICALQIRQYEEANGDFGSQVASLKANLDALVRDADAIAREAAELFGSGRGDPGAAGSTDGSVLADVAQDVDRALDLLHHYCRSDDVLRERVVEVSHGFDAMGRDVRAIRSIDTDMRLMGLNTTLKCTRLGTEGRGLGVVAQELRACSRRTEDVSKAITEAIQTAARRANALDLRSGTDQRSAKELAGEMRSSMDCLNRLHADQMRSLSGLTADCLEVSRLLTGTMDRLAIEQRLEAFARRFVERMEASVTINQSPAPGVVDNLHRLFGNLYTAERERKTHAEFVGVHHMEETGDKGGDTDEFFL